MTDDPAQALAARLASGEFSADDIMVAARTIRALGIPDSERRRIMYGSLRAYREAAYPLLKETRARARTVHKDLSRYAAGAWLRHQHSINVPADIAGKPTEFLWRALKHGAIRSSGNGVKIISRGQLVRIL